MLKKYGFITGLLISFILSILAHYLHWGNTLQFFISCIAIIFVAGFLGKATESVAHYAGDRIGGFLNATFGNAAELIIAFFLVKDGLFGIVKASLTGAIIGNLLLVLGFSILVGGFKFKEQTFNVKLASHNSSLMILAVIALFIPAVFAKSLTPTENTALSLIVAGVLILAYILWLVFSMITHKNELADLAAVEHGKPAWSKGRSILYLVIATVMVGFESEWLVSTLDDLTSQFGLSDLFVGAFVIAIVGNAAEHSAAVMMALKNKVGATVEIAVGSSLQIALFVAPVLVFLSFFMGNTMDIVFEVYELIAIAVAVFITKSISQDGSTNWYEGVLLLAVYGILGVVFFML
ncbi:calcium/proton exchanger [Paenibacillus sp. N1-5-1-14]|uniref:calcium/proton exchanger n=1 Tax=Paenibacillus radicibacter TaxID=2972488 RepID=UPI002158FB16|nr:calcium/proton exchanger [Paenibacillus radicibacter]MCR8641747.1 calcium/proton exchanger [Paenibacillus radicibacter]